MATEAKDAVQYKLDDFKIQLESRVTKEYVEVIGKQIKSGIIDSVSFYIRVGWLEL